MHRWKTQAFLLGLAIGKANSNPLLPKRQSLSSTQEDNGQEGEFDAAKASFEWLAQCAGANIDTDTCLFTKTFDTLVSMGDPSHSDDDAFPTTRRFLQDQEGCKPEISEGDLRSITDISRISCGQMSVEYSNQNYEEFYGEMWKVFSSETCWDELCNSPEVMFELMFNQAVQCAQVEFDVDPCIKDQIFSIMFPSPDSYDDDYYYYDDDYYSHGHSTDDSMSMSNNRVLRSLQEVMNGENTADCVEVNEYELHFFASFVLMEAEGRCAEDGISVSLEDISKATDDLVTLFGSPHCFGDAHACPEDDNSWDDDYATNNTNTDDTDDIFDQGHDGGEVDYFMIAIKYIEQCANIELNLDSCVTRNTLDFFKSWDNTASMPMHRSLQEQEPSDTECIVPEIDNTMLNLLALESKEQCQATTGTAISEEEYNNSTEVMGTFLGAQHCWQALCEEGDNPSRTFMEIMFKEIGVCAHANVDVVDQCIMEEVLDLIFNLSGEESSPEDGLDGIRRKLQRSLANEEIPDTEDDPCSDQRSDSEVFFGVNLLLAGASETCNASPSQLSIAEAELFKLFSAASCWGKSSSECDHDHDNGNQAMYLEFIENKAIETLAQCAEITDATSCVFWRSIEILRFMNSTTQHANDSAGTGPLLQNVYQNICAPPTVNDSDIAQIAQHAEEFCLEMGLPIESHHRLQTVEDLKQLISQPHCFEDLCSPESRDIFVEEWMDECASVDTRYLTRQANQWSDHSPHPLDNGILRCMTEYLIQMQAPPGIEDPWECSLPHVSSDICGFDPTQPSDTVKEAYFYCSGGEVSRSPSPSPSPEMSMSFVYNEGDLNNWPDLPDTYFSYSMSYAYYGYGRRLAGHDPMSDDSSLMLPYVMEMCNLLDDFNTSAAHHCLLPVCELGIEGALAFGDSNSNHFETDDDVTWNNIEPSTSPTAMPIISTKKPTKNPTKKPTLLPTNQPTRQPTNQPSKQPTNEPTASPTATQTEALVEVTFEVAMTLTGIEASDLNITSLDSVVSLLEDVIEDMLPEGAKARLLKVGGYSLTRRLLFRLLQESSSIGVDVEFEVIFSQKCEEVDTCDDSKDTLLEEADIFSSDIVAKVEDGTLSETIAEKATEKGIALLENVTVSPSSLKVTAPSATVIIKKQNEEDVPDSASVLVAAFTLLAAAVVGEFFLFFS